MARKGRGGPALATAAIGSFVAGTIATLALTFVAPLGASSRCASARRLFRADGPRLHHGHGGARQLAVARSREPVLGLALGLVGIDTQTGQARFTLGIPELLDGIDVIVVVVGLFAVGETLYVASRYRYEPEEITPVRGSIWMSRRTGRARGSRGCAAPRSASRSARCRPAAPRSRPSCPTWSRSAWPKRPEEFGHGAIEGVAGPEAANNAAAAGVLVPLLTLGLPTSATAAILLAAFQQYGLQPGPLLFATQPDLVWGLIASLYIGNAMLLLLNLPLVGLWVRVLSIPRPQLYAGILVFATLGAYTLNNNVVDLILLYLIGVVGFGMRVLGVPVAPAVIGLILGPLAEAQFRRALSISQGDWTVFFTDPLSSRC